MAALYWCLCLDCGQAFAVDVSQLALGARIVHSASVSGSMPQIEPVAIAIAAANKLRPDASGGDGAIGDSFGRSVAISGDTAVIGVSGDSVGSLSENGSVYVYKRTIDDWELQAKLIAGDTRSGDHLGESVAISGDTIVVGAPTSSVAGQSQQGAVYVFVRTGSEWIQQAKLTAMDGEAFDSFGNAVAVSGDVLLAGAAADDGGFENQGSVYVFVRNAGAWTLLTKLVAADPGFYQQYGSAVALDGDTAVIGALGDQEFGANAGAAYVMVRAANSWTQQAKLFPTVGAGSLLFGTSVAISGNSVLVGAPVGDNRGAAYVFVREGANWTPEAKLVPVNLSTQSQFGFSVAIDGSAAVIGARHDEVNGNVRQGSAFLFQLDNGIWTEQAKLVADDGDASETFGNAVAIAGSDVLVASDSDSTANWEGQGSVSAYRQSAAAWVLQTKISNGPGQSEASAGLSIAIDGDTAVVGVPLSRVGVLHGVGTVEVFVQRGTWQRQTILTPPAGDQALGFGTQVSLSGDTLLVQATDPTSGLTFRNVVYVFVRKGNIWRYQTRLESGSSDLSEGFGEALAVVGDQAFVAAPYANASAGLVYVFRRVADVWVQQTVLTGGLGNFGSSLQADADTLVVGAPNQVFSGSDATGAAYVFFRDGNAWLQQAIIQASSESGVNGFGSNVAISGNTVTASAWSTDLPGKVYVYYRSGTIWTPQATLSDPLGQAGDLFGASVAIDNNVIVVGAGGHDTLANVDQGWLRVFVRDTNEWTPLPPMQTDDGFAGDQFGYRVAISGYHVLASSPRADGPAPFGNPNEGAAYVFDPIRLFQDGFN